MVFMAVGQAVLSSTLDVGAMSAVEGLLEVAALERCAAHGRRLRLALRLQAVLSAAGAGWGASSQLALVEQSSEQAAQLLLAQAELLAGLPGGLEAVECGLLTVEQCAVVARRLLPLPDLVRLVVWRRLQARLLVAFEQGAVLSPGRLAELLAGWVIEADPADAIARRQAAEEGGSVEYRRRDDGLADLFLNAITGPNAQAILCRIRDRSRPWGRGDTRSAGKRRLDAAVDLLLGRDQLALDDSENPFDSPEPRSCTAAAAAAGVAGAGRCGCRLGELVPCGVQVSLLVPLGAALGTTDEVAMLEGHGPVEPDLLQAVLHNAPVLRPVWVDADGVPVAIGRGCQRSCVRT
ncbi:MAG: hypothetical protein JWN08_361 [Frankiales bacterium]|nr:hypothetical protein [Frankiales bacterium]